MAHDIQGITDGNPVEISSERELLMNVIARLALIDARIGLLESRTATLLEAWATGGLRGLRQAARERSNGRG